MIGGLEDGILKMAAETRESLLSEIESLPKEEWLKLFETEDQYREWVEHRAFFMLLHHALKSYFAGSDFPFPDFERKNQEWMKLQRDRWLILYSMLHDGWMQVKADAQRLDVTLPSSPGEMILLLIRLHAAARLCHCLPQATPEQGNFSPDGSRKLAGEYRKLIAKQNQGKLTKPEAAKWNGKISKHNPPLALTALQDFCVWSLRKASKKDRLLRRMMKAWDVNEAEIEAESLRVSHSQTGTRPYRWVNGQKIFS